jgi:hypothetical protein
VAYRLLTTLILAVHFGYLAYLAVGGFLAWRWPRTIVLHLAVAAWGFTVVAAGLRCPLTTAEDWARRRAGEAGLTAGFIDRYIEGVVYPERYAAVAQALLALVVLVSWVGFVIHRRARRARRTHRARRTADQGL